MILSTKMLKHITKKENNKKEFSISESGLYAISISASCKSGRFFGLWGREDLRVEIDDIKLREIPAEKNSQYYNIPSAWNGSRLKGLTKTIIFLLNLKEGDHIIKFFPKNTATLEKDPEIIKIEDPNNIKLNLNQQAQNGNRRPWITLALIDLPLRILDASIKCEKRFLDSDDVKLIINGKIKQNKNSSRWGKNWYWQGRKMKGETIEERFYLDLEKSNHYIEFWADRMPTLNNLWIYLGIFEEKNQINKEEIEKENIIKTSEDIIKLVKELYAEIGKEVEFKEIPIPVKNFTKYDKEIEIASKEFDVDPIILKATIAQESSFGVNIEHDDRYIDKSGLMGLEKKQSIDTLSRLGYNFNYDNITDVIKASAAYYNWVRERPTTFEFKDKNNPLKLYTQYRSDLKAEGIHPEGIPQFLFYYFYYKE